MLECADLARSSRTRPTSTESLAMNEVDREKVVARFWSSVNKTDSCWIWLAGAGGPRKPYGAFRPDGIKIVKAHRFSYELSMGPIPIGLVIDHLCRNTLCVNPAHLEAVTNKTNILRGTGFSARHAAKTHCPKGHEYAGSNLYIARESTGTGRMCKTCMHDRVTSDSYRAKARAVAAEKRKAVKSAVI